MALDMLLRRMDVAFTVHGFRSAFRDWCGERSTFPREVAEAALAHVIGDATERAYRRGDALGEAAQAHECVGRLLRAEGFRQRGAPALTPRLNPTPWWRNPMIEADDHSHPEADRQEKAKIIRREPTEATQKAAIAAWVRTGDECAMFRAAWDAAPRS